MFNDIKPTLKYLASNSFYYLCYRTICMLPAETKNKTSGDQKHAVFSNPAESFAAGPIFGKY
jgi:hypothetical protein